MSFFNIMHFRSKLKMYTVHIFIELPHFHIELKNAFGFDNGATKSRQFYCNLVSLTFQSRPATFPSTIFYCEAIFYGKRGLKKYSKLQQRPSCSEKKFGVQDIKRRRMTLVMEVD